ncbi:pectin lyase fold/virulence factor [Mycena sp. CBHHK59/15]|nr:pectin lyase fold/virulence factor [Mycena sp. CBHHK59/15]
MQNIKHQGIAAFNPNSTTYQVFRNVKDFGAKGDGITDDTAKYINSAAISAGNRCGGGLCPRPHNRLIGDANFPPTLLAAPNFGGIAVIVDVFELGQMYSDAVQRIPATSSAGTGIHWQVAQAKSLMNIVINMSADPNTAHQGKWFTIYRRNVTANNAQTGILAAWNWGWTFQAVTFNNCSSKPACCGGGNYRRDGVEYPIFLRTSANSGQLDGSLVLNNIQLTNVPTAIGLFSGDVLLAGTYTQGYIAAPNKPVVLLDSAGNIFSKTHPQYAHYAVDQFASVRDHGAKGDGVTDDTATLQGIFAAFSGCKIIFFDAGTYVITSTLTIPVGTQMVGEAWSVIAGKGSTFQDMNNPQPVVQVGAPGSSGLVEITDIIFSTIGPAGGAIVVEWNVKQTTQGGAGMWDSHIRLGGASGTNLQASDCLSNGGGGTTACLAAFAGLHLTSESTAYLEGTWVWLADHDLDEPGGGQDQVSIYSGRGILSESAGPVWLIGNASEHHVLYQYNLANAKSHYMGLIQTETPYIQPNPVAAEPFTVNTAFKDPASWSDISQAWGLWVTSSDDILVFGAALYSFYSNYDQGFLTPVNCQSQMVNVDNESSVDIYSLSTIGTTWQLSINQVPLINQDQNLNGFASTVTSWSSS